MKVMKSQMPSVKCLHDYPVVEESSALILHSSMGGLKDPTVGTAVLHG